MGIVLLVAAVRQGLESETTAGTVVDFETQRGAKDRVTYFAAVVEYKVGEKQYRCLGIASSPPIHFQGQKVQVLYKTQTPAVGYVDSFWDRWLAGLVFTALGVPLLAWAIFSLFFGRMFYRWLQESSPA